MAEIVKTFEELMDVITASKKNYNIKKITAAYEYAATMHSGQKRESGEPYITHPIAVAQILVELGMDTDTICAALLHDVVEDTGASLDI